MGLKKIKTFGEMIKFEHTVFALPFAYLGAFVASKGFPTWWNLLWITLAMAGARTAAMSLNRLIDRKIDARNPRTSNRHLPKGLISVAEVWVYILLSFGLLLVAAWQLNPLDAPIPLTVKLMPIAVFFLTFYSYTKRFTWLCHIVLGISIGLAPVGSWVGITGFVGFPAVILGLAVAAWIAGFDVIYACQDIEFDRREKLHSIPARFGLRAALLFAKGLHLITVLLLVWLGVSVEMGLFYWLGIIISTVILVYEHSIISPADLSRLDVAFFNMNGILSVVLFVFTLFNYLLPNLI